MKRKQLKAKKLVFISALLVFIILIILGNPLFFGFCQNIGTWGDGVMYCRDSDIFPEFIYQIFGFLSIIFTILSLITYRMRDNVFRAWWNFARWWVVVIVVVTILLNFSSGGGYIGMDMEFTALIHTILYGTLIITSIVKIYRAYWANSIQS